MDTVYKLIGPFTQLITLAGLPLKGAIADEQIVPLAQAGILLKGNKIYKTGTYENLEKEAALLGAMTISLEGEYVCIPAFTDAHTHICFAGSRAQDYAMRNSGKTYLEISEAGGGIWDTVQHTRKASLEELTASTIRRANRHLSEGVTTIEVKSGYGLSVNEELKMLRAITAADQETSAELISTCLAAHTLPRDFEGSHSEYLEKISRELFPVLLEENLCNRIDAFVEKGAFSPENILPYFKEAIEQGFQITVHADQFSTGGTAVAVQINALSADHLEASTDKEVQLLAQSDTIAMALPGATIGLGCAFTPARKLLDAGACLAIASDWNPGSAPMGDLLLQASVLGTFEKLSNAEILAGITYRAARALNLTDRGCIEQNMLADFLLFQINDYKEILYQQGKLKPAQVWKNGECVLTSNFD
ncbi:imidazolonepropionase [Pedobacter sp.]|jgi:imidazolonepropionase|uniref:imidazolonepropionase n=1 Tax=Pedobacter sp. TaxID=1411316 RepID=UPI002B9CDE4E|nr:imidazolonepropionase [Pedobacter sp.]HWW42814.1 imidazolonepropionase [Pedobacter sp.]